MQTTFSRSAVEYTSTPFTTVPVEYPQGSYEYLVSLTDGIDKWIIYALIILIALTVCFFLWTLLFKYLRIVWLNSSSSSWNPDVELGADSTFDGEGRRPVSTPPTIYLIPASPETERTRSPSPVDYDERFLYPISTRKMVRQRRNVVVAEPEPEPAPSKRKKKGKKSKSSKNRKSKVRQRRHRTNKGKRRGSDSSSCSS